MRGRAEAQPEVEHSLFRSWETFTYIPNQREDRIQKKPCMAEIKYMEVFMVVFLNLPLVCTSVLGE